MNSKQSRNTDPYQHLLDLNDEDTFKKFNQWIAKSKQTQIRAVSLFTAILYIVAYIVDTLVAPTELLPKMMMVHLYILPVTLFLITLLSFKKALSTLTTLLLILAPVIAAIGNLYIVIDLENPSMRLTEIYLSLFWVFTVSGLRLKHATMSATVIFLMVFIVSYLYLPLTQEYFVMHCFWMTAAYSFGFLGAYLIERSDKAVFATQEQLKKLAITDKLTGLPNRTNLDELLQEELNRSQYLGHTFGLALMDFDYFKAVNDTYGHQIGDEALIEIAQLITKQLRPSDKVLRWGGEEFIIIYPDTNRETVVKLAEDLRQKIASHAFKNIGSRTASLGVTLYKNGDTIDSIIQRADKALYRAKGNGRNRIEYI